MPLIVVGAKCQYETLVDDEDYDYLIRFTWTFKISAPKYKSKPYARRCIWKNGQAVTILMHHEILERKGLPPLRDDYGNLLLTGDHINRETLDNTRDNLRWLGKRGQTKNRLVRSWVDRYEARIAV